MRCTYVPFNPRFLGLFRRGDLSRGRLVRHVIMITAGDVGWQLSMTHSAARRVHTRADCELAVRLDTQFLPRASRGLRSGLHARPQSPAAHGG